MKKMSTRVAYRRPPQLTYAIFFIPDRNYEIRDKFKAPNCPAQRRTRQASTLVSRRHAEPVNASVQTVEITLLLAIRNLTAE